MTDNSPLLKYKKYRRHEKSKTDQVVPGKFFFLEKNKCKTR